ncbi:MAG: hypothetical protein WDO70_08405 [Alphaproteobacteria bacterium]
MASPGCSTISIRRNCETSGFSPKTRASWSPRCRIPVSTRVYILFADPWPKKRHAERRFVQPETLKALARAMKPGAPLMLASDDPVLQEWTAEQMKGAADFTPLQGDGISTVRSPGWIETRYETKALQAGRVPMYFCFKKLLESL